MSIIMVYVQSATKTLLAVVEYIFSYIYKERRGIFIMKKFNYVITDELGIHARPAGILVKEAKAFSSRIIVEANGKSAEATKLLALMQLGAKKGTEVVVTVTGEDEDAAAAKIEAFMKENL